MRKLLFSLFCLLVLGSCQQQKEYMYIEKVREKSIFGGTSIKEKDAELIYAVSDTTAYILAYDKFILSQAAQERSRLKLKENGLPYEDISNTIGFKLYDSNGKDISSIYFVTKTKQEKEIKAKWNKHINPTD